MNPMFWSQYQALSTQDQIARIWGNQRSNVKKTFYGSISLQVLSERLPNNESKAYVHTKKRTRYFIKHMYCIFISRGYLIAGDERVLTKRISLSKDNMLDRQNLNEVFSQIIFFLLFKHENLGHSIYIRTVSS